MIREVEQRRRNDSGRERSSLFGIPIPPCPESKIPITKPDTTEMLCLEDYTLSGVRNKIVTAITSSVGFPETVLRVAEPDPKASSEDYGVACYPLAPKLRRSPVQIAQNLAADLKTRNIPFVKYVAEQNGYVNFLLDHDQIGTAILQQVEAEGIHFGEVNLGDGKVVVIDCSAPNIAKHMSVGHLRSTVIGESLARIYKAAGYTVIRDNHLGDWGTQFGMLGRAYELWGKEFPELNGKNPVNGLYQLYRKMHDEIEKEKGGDSNKESLLEKEGKEWFSRLEQGDPKAMELFRWAHVLSLQEFQRVYDILKVDFEYVLGESYYVPMLAKMLEAFRRNDVAQVTDEGTLEIPLPKGLKPLKVQKSDGATLYATRELATMVCRQVWFNPERILYVVGEDQKDYFRQVFAAYEKISNGTGPKMEHVYFGFVKLPEGKMSTRRGRIVFLEDMIGKSMEMAKDVLVSRNLSEEEKAEIAKQVGVGAVIYFDLGQNRERGIEYHEDQPVTFEGGSPDIQYAYTRANGILENALQRGITYESGGKTLITLPEEWHLVKQIGEFPEAIEVAVEENQPCRVAAYVRELADKFNQFYHKVSILKENDPDKRDSRLRLTAATALVLKKGLSLLGIDAPNKM